MIAQFEDIKIVKFHSERGNDLYDLIERNRNDLNDYFAGTTSKTKTLEDTLAYAVVIEERIQRKEYFPFLLIDKQTDELIGFIDVKNISWSIPKAELGYFIDIHSGGKGITSKAVGLVIDYLIEKYQFKKLLCRVGSKNIGSIKVATKNGFELEGTIRRDYKTTSGKLVDLNYYGRIF
ncbi:MAG: GNAT family N-acetyltransferase [Flavobacteriaceae bacterium]